MFQKNFPGAPPPDPRALCACGAKSFLCAPSAHMSMTDHFQLASPLSETPLKFVNRMAETAFPHLRTELQQINNRKPDLLEIKSNEKECEIIEVTVCFDLYMSESYESKARKYQKLKNILNRNGIKTNIRILCFGSLGTVHEDVRKNLKGLGLSSEEAKSTMKWCSVSNMICGNMIWRNRCKRIHGQSEI